MQICVGHVKIPEGCATHWCHIYLGCCGGLQHKPEGVIPNSVQSGFRKGPRLLSERQEMIQIVLLAKKRHLVETTVVLLRDFGLMSKREMTAPYVF